MKGRIRALLEDKFERKADTLSGLVTNVPLGADGRSLGYITAVVAGQAGVQVRVDPDHCNLAPFDTIQVTRDGNTANAHYSFTRRAAGNRPESGLYQFLTPTTIGGGTYQGGDILIGNLGAGLPNTYITSGCILMRLGLIPQITLDSDPTYILLGTTGANEANTLIQASALSLRVGTAEKINLNTNGDISLEGVMKVGSAGGIFQGTGTFSSPSTALKIYNNSGVGLLELWGDEEKQIYQDTTGVLNAAAGSVALSTSGIRISAKGGKYTGTSIEWWNKVVNSRELALGVSTEENEVVSTHLESNIDLYLSSLEGNVILGASAVDISAGQYVTVSPSGYLTAKFRNNNTGTASPTSGTDNDFFVRTDTALPQLWHKVSGTWYNLSGSDYGATIAEGADITITAAGSANQIGRSGNKVLLYDSTGSPLAEYAAASAGLVSALAAASSGAIVEIPACSINGDQVIPANVTIRGLGRFRSALTGQVTLGSNSTLTTLSIDRSASSGDKLIGVLGTASGNCYIIEAGISVIQSGSGTGYAISVQAGDVYVYNSRAYGSTAMTDEA